MCHFSLILLSMPTHDTDFGCSVLEMFMVRAELPMCGAVVSIGGQANDCRVRMAINLELAGMKLL